MQRERITGTKKSNKYHHHHYCSSIKRVVSLPLSALCVYKSEKCVITAGEGNKVPKESRLLKKKQNRVKERPGLKIVMGRMGNKMTA